MVSRSGTEFSEERLTQISSLKGYQAKYILSVCNHPGVSQDDLAKILFVNKSNVARQLSVLEEEGYVERREDPFDRRVSLVYPTKKAEDIRPIIRQVNAEWREVITEGFSDEEKETLLKLTEKLYFNALKYMEGDK